MVQSSVVNTESEESILLVYEQDWYSSSIARVSNLSCWDILLQVHSKVFVYLLVGLVDSPCWYLCIRVLEGDMMIPGLVFREFSCLLNGKASCLTRVSFTCINDL